jgi:hypothetical protein
MPGASAAGITNRVGLYWSEILLLLDWVHFLVTMRWCQRSSCPG